MKFDTIQIDDPATVRDIQTLAERTGVPAEQAVAEAVRQKLGEGARFSAQTQEERRRRVQETLDRIDRLPKTGRLLTDADLYDDDGLPK